ncbi:MAG: ABC transporter permease [Candidatus Cloacimonadota bacterium]|nr:MAG: ABC transporter permease [Candidatus Cloacimonadota bacterium]
MHVTDSFVSSLQSIASHKFRSFLTLLGIMIGVASVVSIFSLVTGMKNLISSSMEQLGFDNSLVLMPSSDGQQNYFFGSIRKAKRKSRPISLHDYYALKKGTDHKYIYGMVQDWKIMNRNEKRKWVLLSATDLDYFKSKTYPLERGRFFLPFENRNSSKVCVIGSYFVEENFKNEDPLGKFITVAGMRLKVIGILAPDVLSKNGMMMNQWERRWQLKNCVFIPLNTGINYLSPDKSLQSVLIQANDSKSFGNLKDRVTQIMLGQHYMAHDFTFQDIGSEMLKMTEKVNDMMKKMNITLTSIAAVTLLVGGIGLFSTLLISINEKMTEIGVRKSLGATDWDIFTYFIIEAVTLSLAAASAGISFPVLIFYLVSKFSPLELPVVWKGIFMGIGFSLTIGFLSGLYPAFKASKIDPVRAIFYFE